MLVKHSIVIAAPVEKVWDIISDYCAISKWCIDANTVEKIDSESTTIKAKDGSSCRKVINDRGCLTETLVEYSEDTMEYKYKVEGLPSHVLEAYNHWKLEKLSDSECRFDMELTGTCNWFPGMFVEPLLNYVFLPMLAKAMSESLKYYAENGEPSPEKQKQIEACLSSKK